jgi:hypothetical protein
MPDRSREKIREDLLRSLGPAEWSLIRKHLVKDSIIVVSPSLELIEVAISVALNEETVVKAWVEAGLVTKPDLASLQSWEKTPEREFLSVIVQPFILIQSALQS